MATVSPSGAKHWTCGTGSAPESVADGPADEDEVSDGAPPSTEDPTGDDVAGGDSTGGDSVGGAAGAPSVGADGEDCWARASGKAARRQASSVDLGNMLN